MSKRMEAMKEHGFPCDFGESNYMMERNCLQESPHPLNPDVSIYSYRIVLNEGFVCTGCEFKGQEMHLTIATTNWLPKSNELVD